MWSSRPNVRRDGEQTKHGLRRPAANHTSVQADQCGASAHELALVRRVSVRAAWHSLSGAGSLQSLTLHLISTLTLTVTLALHFLLTLLLQITLCFFAVCEGGDDAVAQRGAAIRGLQHGARAAAAGALPRPPPGVQRRHPGVAELAPRSL